MSWTTRVTVEWHPNLRNSLTRDHKDVRPHNGEAYSNRRNQITCAAKKALLNNISLLGHQKNFTECRSRSTLPLKCCQSLMSLGENKIFRQTSILLWNRKYFKVKHCSRANTMQGAVLMWIKNQSQCKCEVYRRVNDPRRDNVDAFDPVDILSHADYD